MTLPSNIFTEHNSTMPPTELDQRWRKLPIEIKMMIVEAGAPKQLDLKLAILEANPYLFPPAQAFLGFIASVGQEQPPEWQRLQILRCVCRTTRYSINRMIRRSLVLRTLSFKTYLFTPANLPAVFRIESRPLQNLIAMFNNFSTYHNFWLSFQNAQISNDSKVIAFVQARMTASMNPKTKTLSCLQVEYLVNDTVYACNDPYNSLPRIGKDAQTLLFKILEGMEQYAKTFLESNDGSNITKIDGAFLPALITFLQARSAVIIDNVSDGKSNGILSHATGGEYVEGDRERNGTVWHDDWYSTQDIRKMIA